MNNRIGEQFQKRQANEQNLRNDLSNHQVAQAQAQHVAMQAQQQQLLLNENPGLQAQLSRAMGQTPQQGFQHLQHQMQVSPMPQQPQQMAMNMMNAGAQMAPNQTPAQMPVNPMRAAPMLDFSKLSDQDKAKVGDLAIQLFNSQDDNQKRHALAQLAVRIGPHGVQHLQRQGREPLMFYYQQQAFGMLQKQGQAMRIQQGLQPNVNPNQPGIQLQHQPMVAGMQGQNIPNTQPGVNQAQRASMQQGFSLHQD